MKKILVITMLISMLAEAYEVQNSHWIADGQKQIDIKCDDGTLSWVYYFPKKDHYYSKNNIYNSLTAAALKACNKKQSNSLLRLQNNTLVCKTKHEMKKWLTSENSYSFIKNMRTIDNDEDCFLVNSNSTVNLLQEYTNETFEKEFQKGEKIWFETVKLIDSYYLVKTKSGNTTLENPKLSGSNYLDDNALKNPDNFLAEFISTSLTA